MSTNFKIMPDVADVPTIISSFLWANESRLLNCKMKSHYVEKSVIRRHQIKMDSIITEFPAVILTNSMTYGTWRFNAAFTRALQ